MTTPPATPLGPRPQFEFPVIHDNPSGWGPREVPEQFKDTPYQPFSKGDRLGKVYFAVSQITSIDMYFLLIIKVADWSGSLYQDRRSASMYYNTIYIQII